MRRDTAKSTDSGGNSPATKLRNGPANSVPVDSSVVKNKSPVKQISFEDDQNSSKPHSPSKVALLNGDENFPGV